MADAPLTELVILLPRLHKPVHIRFNTTTDVFCRGMAQFQFSAQPVGAQFKKRIPEDKPVQRKGGERLPGQQPVRNEAAQYGIPLEVQRRLVPRGLPGCPRQSVPVNGRFVVSAVTQTVCVIQQVECVRIVRAVEREGA